MALDIYILFRSLKDFGFRDQICRAAVSVLNNIAEGFERSSNADFSRFLYFAIGACSEVKSMVYLAQKLDYINNDQLTLLLSQCNEVSKITRGFIKSISAKKCRSPVNST